MERLSYATIHQMQADLKDMMRAINDLTDNSKLTQDEIAQLRIDFDCLNDAIPANPNVWLRPSELGDLVKISTSTVTKYRNEGIFKKSSIKEVKRGKRIDFYYHRINAIKDLSVIRPIQMNNNKKLLDKFV